MHQLKATIESITETTATLLIHNQSITVPSNTVTGFAAGDTITLTAHYPNDATHSQQILLKALLNEIINTSPTNTSSSNSQN